MKKILLVPSLLGVLALSACTPATPTIDTDQTSSEATSSVESSAATVSSEASAESSSTAATNTETETRIVEMDVTDWTFSPSTIRVKKGEKLLIRLKGAEGEHSFGIKDLGINVLLAPGETKDVEIPTDTAGNFEFRCMVPCGPGHKEMKGVIIIE